MTYRDVVPADDLAWANPPPQATERRMAGPVDPTWFPCTRCGWMPRHGCTCHEIVPARPAATKAHAAHPAPAPVARPTQAAAHLPTGPVPFRLPPDPAGRHWAAPVAEVIRATRAAS